MKKDTKDISLSIFLHTLSEKRPCKDTERAPSASQGERSHQKLLCWHLELGLPEVWENKFLWEQGPGVCKLPKPPASRALCQAKRAPRAAFPSGCLAAQTKRWAEGIRVPGPLAGGGSTTARGKLRLCPASACQTGLLYYYACVCTRPHIYISTL